MLRTLICFLIVSYSCLMSAQTWKIDTLKAEFKTRGSFDSLDFHSKFMAMPFYQFGVVDFPDEKLINPSRPLFFLSKEPTKSLIFTALPHIGFGYTFGQQGTQLLHANYQQSLSKLLLINAEISQNISNGIQRNSVYNDLNYQFSARISTTRFENICRLINIKNNTQWSGGLESDSILSILPQNLIDVKKNDANSSCYNSFLTNNSRFNFTPKNSSKLGPEMILDYFSIRRNYYEEGDIATIYNVVNIDSNNTADTISLKSFRSRLGLFYDSKTVSFSSHLSFENWASKTMGRRLDTIEVSVDYNVVYKLKKWHFTSDGLYGLYGNFSILKLNSEIQYRFKNGNLRWLSTFNKVPPIQFLRDYRGNNLDYNISTISLQQNLNFGLETNYTMSIFNAQLSATYIDAKNNYFYNNTNWSTNSLNDVSIFKLKAKMGINFGSVVSTLSYQFSQMNEEIRYLPQHITSLRLAYKTGLFKEGRLKSIIGLDGNLVSSHKRLIVDPMMGSINFNELSIQQSEAGYYTVGAFANFNVNQFRFFFRMDNITYYWMKKNIAILKGYYYPLPQFKIGITWDFWN